jgi:3D (Asp-Asp-Asp) domain-containing protein
MLVRALLIAGLGFSGLPARAAEPDSVTGTVSAVEVKGKTAKLTVSVDGVDRVFDLTPKVELEILSNADDACLSPGLFVKVDAVESNNLQFGRVFSVYPDYVGKVAPAAATKAPMAAGQSVNRYLVTGEIAKFTATPEEKYDALELRGVGKNTVPIYVERQRSVRIVQTDPKLIAAGQAVTVEGKMTGTKFLPTQVTITTGQSIKGEEFLPTLKKKKR